MDKLKIIKYTDRKKNNWKMVFIFKIHHFCLWILEIFFIHVCCLPDY